MSTPEVMLVTATVVSAFWAGALALVALARSYKEDQVTEEIRLCVERLIRTFPAPEPPRRGPVAETARQLRDPGTGRHHIRR